jgi:hypothetical protein
MHACVIVVVDGDNCPCHLTEAVAVALEPYYDIEWDWWELGGRWKKSLIAKDGTKVSYELKKYIDWEKMENRQKNFYRKLYKQNVKDGKISPPKTSLKSLATISSSVSGQVPKAAESYAKLANFLWEPRATSTETEDEFVTRHYTPFNASSVLSKDGTWASDFLVDSNGNVGNNPNWAEECKELFSVSSDDDFIVVVDVHL